MRFRDFSVVSELTTPMDKPGAAVGKAAGLAAKGAGAAVGGAVAGAGRFLQGMKAGYAGQDAKIAKDPAEQPAAKTAPQRVTDIVAPNILKPVLAAVIKGEKLNSDGINAAFKIASKTNDPNLKMIFRQLQNQNPLDQRQLDTVKKIHDSL